MGTRPFGRQSPDETAITGQAPVRLGAPTTLAGQADSLSGWSPRPGLVEPVVRARSLAGESRAPLG